MSGIGCRVSAEPVDRLQQFTLVAPNGTVLASLQQGGTGNGRLQLFDGSTGNQRIRLSGDGAIVVEDAHGTTLRFIAGYTLHAAAPSGYPPILNGIQLDSQGAITMMPPTP